MNDFKNITLYSDHVASLAQNKSNELIPNGSNAHAIVLIQSLFLNAEKKMRIFSSMLKREIYEDNQIINGLANFLNKPEAKLEIIVQDYHLYDNRNNLSHNNFFKICSDSDKCSINVASEKDRLLKEHFVIMDDMGYRFCPDKNGSSAVASFNRPTIAANLIKQFDILFGRSEPIEVISK